MLSIQVNGLENQALRHARPLRRWVWMLLLCLGCLGFPAKGAVTFKATLDRDTITLGESATLSLTFNGASPQQPGLPEIPGLQVDYVGPSSQMSFINGQVSSTMTHNFIVSARQAGDYTIPGFTVEIGDQKLTSRPLKLKVLKPGAPAPEAIASGAQDAFLRLVLPKKEVYVGETIVAQLEFCLGNRVQRYGQPQLATFPADGFNVGKMQETQQRQAQFGTAAYRVIPINVALKAVKAGPLSIGPVTANMVVELASGRRQQRDPLDVFGFFGGGGERKQLTLATETESVQVLPLPRQDVPGDFTGAVGSFTMNVTAGPTTITAGDPITVKIQISGRGSLDSINLPEQTAWHDFKAYPPTSKIEATDSLGLEGTKTFEQLVTPQNAEVKALPPFSFSFFDPESKAYQTLSQAAIPLVVRPAAAAAAPTVLPTRRSAAESAPAAPDIVPNKQRLGAVAQIAPPLLQQPWFLAAQGVPVLALVSVIAWRRRAENLANNPRLRRQRQVERLVKQGLEELRQHAAANRADEFFAGLFRLLQEQLGERLDLPASAITEAVIDERLRPARVAEPLIASLHELFQTCNLARYAPIRSSQELAAIIPRLEKVLQDLRTLKL